MRDLDYADPWVAAIRWSYVVDKQADRVLSSVLAAVNALDPRSRELLMHLAHGDRHFFFTAARVLIRAVDGSGLGMPVPEPLRDRLVLMRDVLEHFDEYEVDGARKAGFKYRTAFPDAHPLTDIEWIGEDDLDLGGGVELRQVQRLARELHEWLTYPHGRIYPSPGPAPTMPSWRGKEDGV